VLNTLRWAAEIRPMADLKLPAEGKTAAGLKAAELKMAAQLIGDMTGPWKSDQYTDQFSDAILTLVRTKVEAGETATVNALEAAPSEVGASNVVDLTDLLAKSLARRSSTPDAAASAKKATSKAAAKTASPATPRRRAAR
jgi:DNA end-binding protein Ku